jgi:hypothetical protein
MLTMDISQRMIYFYRPSITCNDGICHMKLICRQQSTLCCYNCAYNCCYNCAYNCAYKCIYNCCYNCAYKSSYKQVELVDCQFIENMIELVRTSYYLTIGTQYKHTIVYLQNFGFSNNFNYSQANKGFSLLLVSILILIYYIL